jgi:alpha-L-fucosidase 2
MARFEPDSGVADYRRSLDMDTGIHRAAYALDGVRFEREALISYPARVLAVRLTGGAARVLLRRAGRVALQCALDERTLCLKGVTGNDGIAFCCVVRAGGEGVRAVGDMLRVPDGGVLYVASATSFRRAGIS